MQSLGIHFVNDIYSISSYEPTSLGPQNTEFYEISVPFPPGVVCTREQEPTLGGLCIVK